MQILGGHWAVLQSVAWAKMLVDYAQQDSLKVAVVKTFDGEHPCSLCHQVSEGRKQEQKKEAVAQVEKIEAVLAPVIQLPPRAEAPRRFFVVARLPREVVRSPLTPPPRLA